MGVGVGAEVGPNTADGGLRLAACPARYSPMPMPDPMPGVRRRGGLRIPLEFHSAVSS